MLGRYLLATVAATALLIGEARADSTVAAMTAAGALAGPELFYCVQTAADRNCTATQLKTFVTSSGVVTSVGFSVPATSIFTATGSPVTGSGTLGFTTAGTSGGIPYFSSAAALSSSAVLTANGVVIGGGAGVAPVSTAAGGANTFFMGSAGAPSFATAAAATAALGLFSTSTTAQGVVPGSNGAAATSFLNATGAWSVPAGGSGGVTIGATITGSCTSGFNLYSNAGVIGCQANGGGGLPIIGTGLTYTTNTPLLDLSQTWNAVGTTFQAIRLNVTNTASAPASRLMDLQVGGTTSASFTTDGWLTFPNQLANNIYKGVGNKNGNIALSDGAGLSFQLITGSEYFFGATSTTPISLNDQVFLYLDGTNLFAQRNGVNAQGFRVYNTFTDASNYERGVMDWATTANTLTIGTQASGTGVLRPVVMNGSTFTWTQAGTPAFTLNNSVAIHSAWARNFGVGGGDITPTIGIIRLANKVIGITDGTTNNPAGWHQWAGEARATANTSITSSTTLTPVTGLTTNVQAGRTYGFQAELSGTWAAAGGVRAAIAGTATATNIVYDGWIVDSAANGIKGNAQSAALAGVVANAATTGTAGHVTISGAITVNAAGTLLVQAAQSVSNAGATVILQGSTFFVWDMP